MLVPQSHTTIAQERHTSMLVQGSLERALNSDIRILSAMMCDDVEGYRYQVCLVVERIEGERLDGDKEKVSCGE